MSCEMVKKGTLDEFLDTFEELPRPIGIMVFGADYRAKNMVFKKIVEKIKSTPVYKGRSDNILPTSWPVETKVSVGNNVIVKMDGDMSAQHGERHQLVLGLRNNGAKSIICVYVKTNRKTSRQSVQEQITKLKKHPPTADGVDCLIIVDE